MDAICDDLAAEHAALDALVCDLPTRPGSAPTPAEGWAVRDQISHLWFFDDTARLAVTDADAFAAPARRCSPRRRRAPTIRRSARGRSLAPARAAGRRGETVACRAAGRAPRRSTRRPASRGTARRWGRARSPPPA